MPNTDDLLQSDGWERFQRALGRTTVRVDGILTIAMPLPFGLRYFYSPRGILPTGHCEEPQRRSTLTLPIAEAARDIGSVFWRGEYPINLTTHDSRLTTPLVLRRAIEPEWTWRTPLAGSDDERLAAMHEKHRYNIRVAVRRGVGIRNQESGIRMDDAWFLLQETARRQGISTHPRAYYETMLRELSRTREAARRKADTDCHLYLAEHDGQTIACAIIASHGDTATYLHGGSSYAHRALMAPHLLHWRAMCDAKAAGLAWYDWGGIESGVGSRESGGTRCDPHASRLTPHASDWSGLTRFKQGFNGEMVHHPPTWDLIFRPHAYRMLSWLARVRP